MIKFACDNPDHDHDVLDRSDTVNVTVIISDSEETQQANGHYCVEAGDSIQSSLESQGLTFSVQ